MQWRTFDQASVPQEKVFLLCLDNDIFFAKVSGNKIITKNSYNDARDVSVHGIRSRGGDIGWFLQNLSTRKVVPMWCHFHKPGVLQ